MKIDKAKLQKLQGLIPCTSNVTFTPPIFESYASDEDLKDYIPVFTCKMLDNNGVEMAKQYGVDTANMARDKKALENKKGRLVDILGGYIVGWEKMYDLSNGEEVKYSSDNIQNLTETVLDSILMELCRYAGVVPR